MNDELIKKEERRAAQTRKHKYECPSCERRLWGGAGAEVKCVPCGKLFIEYVATEPGRGFVPAVNKP